MKQETLEDAAVINYKKLYEGEPLTQDVPIDAFKQGAKWQMERSYSEEDLKTAWDSSEQNMRFTFSSSMYRNISFEQWLEQFKKE
jgi:hypothetical protein